jgi:hypothetical protein
MNVAAGPELAAAVTNAGGLGVIGGVGYTPNILRQQVRSYYSCPLDTGTLPFVGKVLTFYCLDSINQGRPKGQECSLRCRLAHSASWWKCS